MYQGNKIEKMKSELQKKKEKRYYQILNDKIFKSLKKRLDDGGEIYESELRQFEGPDTKNLVEYLKQYSEMKKRNKGGFII